LSFLKKPFGAPELRLRIALMIAVDEALEIVRRRVGPGAVEKAPLARAFGRILARDLAADGDFPPFETTAMDGYAVRFRAGSDLFRIREGVVAAGQAPPPSLSPGEASRVMTGAPVPEGTDAVVPLEEARESPEGLRAGKAVKPGAHLRRRGEIFRRGDPLLARGARLTPEAILLAATIGAEPVPVFSRPRCAVASTGSEIVGAAAAPGPGQIRNSNGPAIVAAFARRGIEAAELSPVADGREDLEAFFSGPGFGWDLLVTSGGVSRGDFDHTTEAAVAAGYEIHFHGVAVKPGKPVAFGSKGASFWLGLPGNPVSALTTFEIFGAEILARREGLAAGRPRVSAALRPAVAERGNREVFRDCLLEAREGRLTAEALPSRGSHDVLTLARRNALLRLPAGGGGWEEGTLLDCLPLGPPFE
jgi:molybdopterin molybdotransferase